jgi:hypothetical protein
MVYSVQLRTVGCRAEDKHNTHGSGSYVVIAKGVPFPVCFDHFGSTIGVVQDSTSSPTVQSYIGLIETGPVTRPSSSQQLAPSAPW